MVKATSIQLRPSADERKALMDTLREADGACSPILETAFQAGVFGWLPLHHKVYKRVRATTRLSSQMTIRCIAKVAESYKAGKRGRERFREKIRQRPGGIRVIKRQPVLFSKWSFDELKQFVQYKAEARGVRVILVDPHYTSQCCSQCLYVARENRKSQSEFECCHCHYTAHADINAALVIKLLARRHVAYGGEIRLVKSQLRALAPAALSRLSFCRYLLKSMAVMSAYRTKYNSNRKAGQRLSDLTSIMDDSSPCGR